MGRGLCSSELPWCIHESE
nr:unnamed protein product [Callosobruchus analis]